MEKIMGSMVKLYSWDLMQKILDQPRYIEEKRLLRFGFKAYSQNEEDGIIKEIFKRIGTTNKTFVEIGVGNGLENITCIFCCKAGTVCGLMVLRNLLLTSIKNSHSL